MELNNIVTPQVNLNARNLTFHQLEHSLLCFLVLLIRKGLQPRSVYALPTQTLRPASGRSTRHSPRVPYFNAGTLAPAKMGNLWI
ncbi:unnamed protein product [Protopolystoma xenopodis]|uniref:Uncharacterized protein n=1 Tax=Protopolystoma xenopodis TaxID=117903 RepID=A0A3S5AGG0_9PLAT|nr:unnamed protein product [Protopolystoma xenopodis]